MNVLLEAEDLDVRYGDFQALSGVGVRVGEGGALALVGANGAGKTTLLRTIAGAHRPARGRIRFAGADVTDSPPHQRVRAGIALVPEGRRLFPSLTAEENIRVGAVRARPGAWTLPRLYEVFPLIARCRTRRAALLSGGEQQAVAIARALASGPRLLLLDEISLGLAPAVVDGLYGALAELRATGTAVILVEQDLDRALAACHDLVCLLEGRVALSGPTDRLPRDQVIGAYFGSVS
ncbi:ABC transporter ATP-binding protein [Actinoplanes lobatus]|uniref:ABC transporter ATP-binding protein n=1 Tax=Actinoplanes lobatus TaxID=113568 RepID=A0A7W7HIH5_9ACTN|nr:ABC transporter ATP-binding protein [Actinoplanes lobatus]MBB4751161.1 branched-chain amino acid transport system ATP-binding protein [Actinoplanes lobatus]GGN94647.1 ABC transporter ATP-binding protein [Actinoplanes lobatus]GIE44656.1 ABC transporter ATP-binding protein [Actinoplanes lobatus]